jgi:hypothetical protein
MDLLGSYPVQVERYASLSPSWGIFTTDSLDDMTDEEVQASLAFQSVYRSYMFFRRRDGKPFAF